MAKTKTKRLTHEALEAICKEVLDDIKFTIGHYPSPKYHQIMLYDDNLVEIEARRIVELEDAITVTTGLQRTVYIGIWGGGHHTCHLYLSIER